MITETVNSVPRIPATTEGVFTSNFESGFKFDRDTVYVDGQVVNQYHGVSDRDLAFKLAEFLGIDPYETTAMVLGRTAEVTAIKEAIRER